jgi:anti-sigma factor RsiW
MNWAAGNDESERGADTKLEIEADNLYGDRFELLSAYLDGEASAAERQQVQSWLDSDLQTRELYQRLLELRRGWQNLATPTSNISANVLAGAVFARVDQRQKTRKKWLLAGGTIAALFAGALFTSDPVNYSTAPQLANQFESESGAEELLAAVSLDEPAVRIPKAANNYLPKEVNLHLKN